MRGDEMNIEEIHKRMILGLPVIHRWPTTGESECRIKQIYGWLPEAGSRHWTVVLTDRSGTEIHAAPEDIFAKEYPKAVLPKV